MYQKSGIRFLLRLGTAVALFSSLAAVASNGVCVLSLGAKGDGVTDDTAALQEGIRQAVEEGSFRLCIPPGNYLISDTLLLPSGFRLEGSGAGATKLLTAQSPQFNAIEIADAINVVVSDLSLIEKDHEGGLGEARSVLTTMDAWKKHGYQPQGAGIEICGDSREILIERVWVIGFRAGFSVGRKEPSMVNAVTIRDCQAESGALWGYEANNCESLLLDNVRSYRHRLDGIKGRRQAHNITIRNGESSESVAGDGYDGYAGTRNLVIDGLIARNNASSGIYIKSGPLTLQGFGEIGNVEIRGVRCIGNGGSGLDINRSGGDQIKAGETELAPLPAYFTVIGGVFEDNGHSGIYVRGEMISIQGSICRNNQRSGISLSNANQTVITGVLLGGNAAESNLPQLNIGNSSDIVVTASVLGGPGAPFNFSVENAERIRSDAAWIVRSKNVLLSNVIAPEPVR